MWSQATLLRATSFSTNSGSMRAANLKTSRPFMLTFWLPPDARPVCAPPARRRSMDAQRWVVSAPGGATQQHEHGAYGRRKHHQWYSDHYHGWPPLDGGFSKDVLVGV